MKYWTADIETMRDEKTGSALTGRENYVSYCNDLGEAFGSANLSLTDFLVKIFLVENNKYMRLYFHSGFRFDLIRVDWTQIAKVIDDNNWLGKWITDIEGNPKALNIYDREDIEYFNTQLNAIKAGKKVRLQKLKPLYSICDSFMLTGMSLSNLTDKFSPEFKKQKRLKSFDEYPFNPNDPEDVKYAIQDALSLHKALESFNELLNENFNVSLNDAFTAPGLAMKVFKKKNQKAIDFGSIVKKKRDGSTYEVAKGLKDAARQSYNGGMTLAFDNNRNENITGIDCNSMYPYVMLNYKLPAGKAVLFRNFKYEDLMENDLVLCDLYIPENVFPILKSKNDKDIVGNWCGNVSGVFWAFEIWAQLDQGAQIVELHRMWRWDSATDCVKNSIQKFKDLRYTDYNGPLGAVAKLLGNSLYGKFAQRSNNATLYCTNKPLDNMIELYPAVYISYENNKNEEHDLTHWASYICARARIHLFKSICALDINNVVYCDTDSIYFKSEYIDRVSDVLGNDYGQFKIERKLNVFHAYAPKAYYYIDDQGKIGGKNKGIPRAQLEKQLKDGKTWEEIEKVNYVGLNSMRVMMKDQNKDLGKLTSRKLASKISITNGYFNELGKWCATNSNL